MLGIAGVPSVIQFIGFLWLPESPRWLVEKGRESEAKKALQQIRKTVKIEKELKEIIEAVHEERQGNAGDQGKNCCVGVAIK